MPAMVSDEKYTLPPEVEAELVALPTPTAASYLDRLLAVPIEVVVVARRQAADRMLRDQIDSILVERSLPRIRAAVYRHSGVPQEELNEAQSEAMLLFWEEIQRESFFEVRFNSALKLLAKRAGRNIRGGQQREHERSALRIGSDDSEESHNRDTVLDIPDDSDEYSRWESRHIIEIGLASLPHEQARAINLHYFMGLNVYSIDPGVRTVASELGCGERKARRLVADGLVALRRSIGQEDSDEW